MQRTVTTLRPFRYNTTSELVNTLVISSFCAFPWLVKRTNLLLETSIKLIGAEATCFYLDKTAGKVFSAGETNEDLQRVLTRLSKQQLGAIIDYCAEGETTEEGLDKNTRAIIDSVKTAAAHKYPAVAVKLTAISNTAVLARLNEVQKAAGSVYSNNMFQNLSKEGLLEFGLSLWEVEQVHRVFERARLIARHCSSLGVDMMVDAEQTFYQYAIDAIVTVLQREFNSNHAVVSNTVQCYLKDSVQKITDYIEYSNTHNLATGIKLVRGAYLNEEKDLAAFMKYESPIWSSKSMSDHAYDENLKKLLYSYQVGNKLCVATHNEQSVLIAQEAIEQMKIDRKYGGVTFGQLLGMKAMMSESLASSGFATQKYVPYGPVQKLMPYLVRRAAEQSEVVKEIHAQVRQVLDEFKLRSKSVYYSPN